MEVDLEWLAAVVARHCPTFFIHPADRFMPCSTDWFLQHSQLHCTSGGEHHLLLPRGRPADGAALLEAQARAPPGTRLFLDLHPDARCGQPVSQLADVPVYAHPKAVAACDGSGDIEAIEITYCTLYAYNGPYRVGGAPFLQTGAHDGDWEHITVRAHPATGDLLGVWYNAHRSRDGCWVPAHEVPRAPDGSIAAFTALHGHGVYPRTGRIPRHFFLGNDLCSASGPVWRPRRVVLLPPFQEGQGPQAGPPATIGVEHGGAVPLDSAAAAGCGTGGEAVADATVTLGASLDALKLDDQPQAVQQEVQQQQQQQRSAQQEAEAAGGGGQHHARSRSRTLQRVPSRGSSLGHASLGSSGSRSRSGGGAAPPPSALPVVDAEDPCLWLWFRGDWGSDGPPGPSYQGWYHRAECPVSRSPLLRVVGHLVGEPDRV